MNFFKKKIILNILSKDEILHFLNQFKDPFKGSAQDYVGRNKKCWELHCLAGLHTVPFVRVYVVRNFMVSYYIMLPSSAIITIECLSKEVVINIYIHYCAEQSFSLVECQWSVYFFVCFLLLLHFVLFFFVFWFVYCFFFWFFFVFFFLFFNKNITV